MATALAASSAAGLEAAAAQAPPQPAPAAPSPAASPEASLSDDLATVRAQHQRNAQQMDQVKLPRDTEPAFHFKA